MKTNRVKRVKTRLLTSGCLLGRLTLTLLFAPYVFAQSSSTLQVTSFTPTFSGFEAQFNRPLDTSVLNLYSTETGGFGPPDVTLIRASNSEAVRGSLIVDATSMIVFVKTAGQLVPDTYTVTLRSAVNGFKDLNGNLLDGNGDGTPGDDFVKAFTVPPPNGPIASIPDFTYGPGQVVYVPFDRVGLAITLSDGSGIKRVEFILVYDPNLLRINTVGLGDNPPPDALIDVHFPKPGVNNLLAGTVLIVVTTQSGFLPGSVEVVRLGAEVPFDAPYRAVQTLFFQDNAIKLNDGAISVITDDAVHLVAYFGDATGNASYSSLDAQRILRVAVEVDAGFAAYPTVDPVLVADITHNDKISALDGTRVLQEVAGLDRPEIHNLPAITSLSVANGTVGSSLVIRGWSFVPGNTTVTFNGTPSTIISLTNDTIETFVPIGATTGRLIVKTDNGFASNNFDVQLSQDFTIAVLPSTAAAMQGASTNYTVQLANTGGRPFSGLAVPPLGACAPFLGVRQTRATSRRPVIFCEERL